MYFQLFQPYGYSEIGGRANNEDSIFPEPDKVSVSSRLFIVCDGVGGAQKGEIASKLACKSFEKFFAENNVIVSTKETIEQALAYVEQTFDDYFSHNPLAKGMATTATLVHLHEQGATIAHIGDSRVYLVRDGNIIFQTKDHSFVMELYENGFISLEEAQEHPRRNEITRAIQGRTVKETKPDVTVINTIKTGDVFFLCTDGVTEQVNENVLEDTVRKFNEPAYIGKALIDISAGQTKDNFSAYIVKIRDIIVSQNKSSSSKPNNSARKVSKKVKNNDTSLKAAFWIILILLGITVAYFGYTMLPAKYLDFFKSEKKQGHQSKQKEEKAKIEKKNADTLVSKPLETTITKDTFNNKTAWAYLFLEKRDNFYGLVNRYNTIKLPFRFEQIEPHAYNGRQFFWVKEQGRYGLILLTDNGIKYLQAKYDTILSMNGKLKTAMVRVGQKASTLSVENEFKKIKPY